MELTPWKLPHGTYTMDITSSIFHHGSFLVQPTPWKLPTDTYTMEVT